MNATQLLTHFDRLAEAPDAVPRLRQLILELAVRGKLSQRATSDAPTSSLAASIKAARLALVKQSGSRRGALVPLDDVIEAPFRVPAHWSWMQLRDLGAFSGGMTPSKARSEYWDGDINWFSPKDIKSDELIASELKISAMGLSETGLQLYPPGCLFMVARSGILKRTFPVSVNRVPAAVNQDLKVLRPYLTEMVRYLQLMLKGMQRLILNTLVKTGTTVQSLLYEEFEQQLVPVPPLAEQHRIVAKVDELMTLCDQLEAAQQERERRRDRLVAASMQRLNQPTEANSTTDQTEPAEARQQAQREQQKDHARFHLQNLNRLTTRPEHIKAMRQTFLNLAVRGKLLRQDANDESAHFLLAQIEIEKSRASRKKLATKQAPGESIEIPPFFGESLPVGWAISKLGDLCTKTGSGSTPAGGKDAYVPSGTPFLRSQNIYDDGLRMDSVAYISEATQTRMSATTVMPKDVLLNITGGSIGRCAIVPDTFDAANINQHVAIIRLAVPDCGRFVHCVIRSAYFQAQIFGNQTGAGREGLPKNRMDEIPIPVPPPAEQHRIVAKVDELMALCDQLEAQLTQSQTDSRRLLEAVLEAALTPA